MPERTKRAAAWTKVAFGDVVRQVKDRVDPEQSGLERYVAGEHMDTDDLRLRRWGDIGDGYLGPAFHMRFKSGHVLYGSRRTYLRKVAVADFEGITANTTYVLEPKDPRALLPELLPFIMQTEAFNQHSVRESKGSVNPYVNFSDLAWFAFDLPPIEEQRRITRLLATAWTTCEALQRLLAATEEVQAAHRDAALVGPANLNVQRLDDVDLPGGWQLVPAREIAITPVTSGVTPKGGQTNPDPECRFIKVGDLGFDGRLHYDDSGSRLSRQSFDETRTLHVEDGDVLTNIVGPPLGKVSVVPLGFGTALINQAIVRFRMPNEDMRDWLAEFLMSRWAKQWLFARSKKTSGQRNINARTCGELPIPTPPESVLATQLQMLRSMRDSVERARERLSDAQEMCRILAAEALHQ